MSVARLRRLAPLVLAGLALVLLVRTAVSGGREVADGLAHPDWRYLAAMLAAAALAMAWVARQWGTVVRALGVRVGTGRAVRLYFAGELGKYVPGGIWPVVGRAELLSRSGRSDGVGPPRPLAYASVLLSLAYLFLASLLLAAMTALVPDVRREVGNGGTLLVLLLLPAGLVAVHPAVAGTVFRLALRLVRRPGALPPTFPAWTASVTRALSYAPAWAGIVTATWCSARALELRPGLGLVALATCLSWVAGFVVVPAPGGLGVREAIFGAVLGRSMPADQAAAVALLARMAFVAVDGVGGVAALVSLSVDGRRRAARETSGQWR